MPKSLTGGAEENVRTLEEKATEVLRKLLNEDRNNFYLSPYIIKMTK
jgi:hypothetical protein